MDDSATRCQCKRWPASPCSHRMTQEDLVCDPCRDGCLLITIGGGFLKPEDQPSFHVKTAGFDYRVTSVPS